VPVVVDLRDGWRVSTPESGYEPRLLVGFAAGLHDAYALIEPVGPTAGVQIDLTPLAARRLFGVPMQELANRAAPLDDLLGGRAGVLRDRLGEARTWPERFAILDQTFAGWLAGGPVVSPGVEWAWSRLESSAGAISITALARELGWSRKRLVVHFREDVGLGPKAAARVLRFEALVSRLRSGRRHSWAELALDLGYFDQAHLAREVRRLAGVTPSQLLAEIAMEAGGGESAVAV
jgi:AraC-like DNA-binding protein